MGRWLAGTCAVALFLATVGGVIGQTASPEEIRRLEQEVRAAEGARQRAEDRRVHAQRAFEKARLNATQISQRVAQELTRVSEQQALAKAMPDGEQKTTLLNTLSAREAELRQEMAKGRGPVEAAQKERLQVRSEIERALAAENDAKAKLSALRSGAPLPTVPPPAPAMAVPAPKAAPLPSAPPPASAAKVGPPPVAAPAALKTATPATAQEQARANREKWEKTLQAITNARLEIEALTVNDEERLRAQIQEAAANRAKIEQIADPERKARLMAQLSELEKKLKAEFAAVTAQVNEARQREAAAKAEYDKAVAAEQEILKRSAGTKSGR
jgi:hypothetical protein